MTVVDHATKVFSIEQSAVNDHADVLHRQHHTAPTSTSCRCAIRRNCVVQFPSCAIVPQEYPLRVRRDGSVLHVLQYDKIRSHHSSGRKAGPLFAEYDPGSYRICSEHRRMRKKGRRTHKGALSSNSKRPDLRSVRTTGCSQRASRS
jgi:hypothetical protein